MVSMNWSRVLVRSSRMGAGGCPVREAVETRAEGRGMSRSMLNFAAVPRVWIGDLRDLGAVINVGVEGCVVAA
jgi:hypothetical protein